MNILKKLKIKNFQSHSDSTIEFDDGINVITGESDSGKSSIFRSLFWNFRNKPAGFHFKRRPTNRGATTSVSSEFGDGTKVIRSRGTDHNSYQINDEVLPDAVRSDVPFEVEDAVNIGDYSIQRQLDRYFLIQDTPGEVAKEMNKIVGLDIIHKAQKKANQIHAKASSDRDYTKERLVSLTEKFKDMAYIDKLEKLANRIHKDLTERESKRREYKSLLNLIHDIETVEESIAASEDWLEIKDESKEILDEVNTLRKEVNQLKGLSSMVNKVETISNEIGRSEELIVIRKDAREIWQIKEEIRKLKDIFYTIQELDSQIYDQEERVEEMKDEHIELVKQLRKCPMCGSPLSTGAHKSCVIEWYEAMNENTSNR